MTPDEKIDLSSLLAVTEELAELGYWCAWPDLQQMQWSAKTHALLGDEQARHEPTLGRFKKAFVDGGEELSSQLKRAMREGEAFAFDKYLKLPAGVIRKVHVSGLPEVDEQGSVQRCRGLLKDVTEESGYLTDLLESQRLLKASSAVANIGYWRVNFLSGEVFWSDEVYRIHGYEPGEFQPDLEKGIQAYHPDDRQRVQEAVSRSQSLGEPFSFSARIIRPTGEIRHVVSKGLITREDGLDIILFGVFQDVSEQVQNQEQSRLWQYLIEETPEAIVITNAEGKVIWVNKSFEKLSGYRSDEVIGQNPGAVLQGPDTDPESISKISKALQQRKPIAIELLNYTKLGEPYWIRMSIFPRYDDHAQLAQFMAIEIDITERVESQRQLRQQHRDLEALNFRLERQKQAAEDAVRRETEARARLEQEIEKSKRLQDELRKLANTDSLTGIPNRRYFMSRAESEFNRAQRYKEALHLVMFDVDHFKQVNDVHGHHVGDLALKTVVNVVVQGLREDVDIMGRLGGEEFCIALPHTRPEHACDIAERIRKAIEQTLIDGEFHVTCSFGLAYASDFDDFRAALQKADEALYLAKHSGRNRVQYWQADKGAVGV